MTLHLGPDERHPGLRDRVLERLGLRAPPAADLAGLTALYAAWCAHVPFDNVRKMIALRTSDPRPLPGGQARDFFEHWLADGAGGTCWPTSNALYSLAHAVGFEAERVVGQMRDLGCVNHGSTRVRLGDGRWIVDSSLLHDVPLPLDAGIYVRHDPVYAAEVEPLEDGAHRLWVELPPATAYLPCRLLPGEATLDAALAAYEATRERSPFNQRLFARRNRPGELVLLVGHTRYSKSAAGLAQRELGPEALRDALCEEIGLSERLVEAWVEAGGLAASMQAPSDPAPLPPTALPPSQRATA